MGIIALVDDRWSELWQPRHHIVSRLATYFRVLWVEPAADWRNHLAGLAKPMPPLWETAPALDVLRAGSSVPRLYRPQWLAAAALHLRWRAGAERLRRAGCRRLVLYVWRPQFAAALDAVSHDLSCYHIDDEYSWSEIDLPLAHDEHSLIQRADRVFIHSPALLQKKGGINPNTICIPNGVDFAAYSTPVAEPEDLSGISRPRIGYSGFVKRELDLDLILRMAQQRREWSFVFAGHVKSDLLEKVDMLREQSNVHFLGRKSVTELASYPQHYDVCIMPYRVTDYTKYIYPMKLHEYLASGRPVVGSVIPSLLPFAEHVRLAGSVEEWDAALLDSLVRAENTEQRRRGRQAIALEHDWDVLVERIAQSIAEDLSLPWDARESGTTGALRNTAVARDGAHNR